MAKKYDMITDLAKYTAKEVVKNPEEWKKYLTTASRLYKYPFTEQLLIYAQRPEASACASIEIWNGSMNCWVNKGAKGIALIDEDAPRPRLKYVFDVADVHKARRIGRDPYLWKFEEEHENIVLERLEKIYGTTDERASFADRIFELTDKIAMDSYEELLVDFPAIVQESFLEELDELSLKVRFRETLASSMAFTILKRCGVDTEAYAEQFHFDYVYEFNTVAVLAQLGTATTELCKPVLMEIGKAIRSYERDEKEKEVANASNIHYNTLTHESEAESKGGSEYGNDISTERRLFNPEPSDGYAATGGIGNVRTDEKSISEGTQEGDLFGTSSVEQADEPPIRDTENSRTEDGGSHETDDESRGSDRETQSRKSDGLGGHDEQHQTDRTGNGADRTDIQLKAEQTEPDSHELPGFFTEDIVRGMLCYDNFLKNKRPAIAGMFLAETDREKRTEYIKHSYNKDYTEINLGVHRVGYKTYDDGLVLWQGNYLTRSVEIKLSWDLVQELISSYIKENVYLLPGEEIPQQESKESYQQLSLFPSVEEQIGNIAVDNADTPFAIPTASFISDEFINRALLSGGGKEHSRSRIYAKYQKGLSHEEMAEFLKAEYAMGGKGFTFDETPFCVWYDEDGMKFSVGNAARFSPMRTISWEEVEERTATLITSGQYMGEAEAWQVPVQEKNEIASKVYFFFRDEYGSMPEELEFTNIYPTSIEAIVEHMETTEGIDRILGAMDKAIDELERGEVDRRFRSIYQPKDTRKAVAELKIESLKFPKAEQVEVPYETFITQDEIDHRLSRGSGFSEGLFRIYDFFLEENVPKKQADFLKQEYGIGGSSPALVGTWHSHENHDSKGLELNKGSIMEPTAKILLTWPKVAERIRKLIDTDRFLSPKAKEKYQEWKREKEEKALEKAKEELGIVTEVQQPQVSEKRIVAIENTEDYSDPSIGFFTYHYQDGREGIRYRLVTQGENGLLEAYPEKNKFFVNGAALQEYIDEHRQELEIIGYDEMVSRTGHVIENRELDVAENEFIPIEASGDIQNPFAESKKEPEPTVDKSGAVNFRITNEDLGVGGAKQKFDRNVAAILTLQLVESENRIATAEEQEILSQYTGWGGLAEAFDSQNSSWTNEYLQLKGMLSESEYASARESTLNAHYTSPIIIRSIYEAIERMGFEKGNILEPAMGIGNFFGMLPTKLQESRLYGVELDGLTGRIARQLYPHADIEVSGFEKTNFPNDFFDVVVGNVPFGQYKVVDKPYDKHNFLIHDYFLAKSLDKVRAGGVVAVVTSKGTMDKKSPAVRKYLAQRAELLGAVRLPNTAFKENAGTEVTSDILFFQKRDRVMDIEPDWVYLGENEDGIIMNQYFVDHPEMIVGKMEMVSGPFGMEPTCNPDLETPFEEQLKAAVLQIDGKIETVGIDELEDEGDRKTIPADPNVKNFSFTVLNDEVYYRENSVMKPVEVSDTMLERIKGMVAIRDCTNELIAYQLDEYGDTAIKGKQTELNGLYDRFTKKYGLINSQTNKRAFNQDSSYCLLCSLEVIDENGELERKADMFSKRTIKKQEIVSSVDTASEALAVSMSEKAKVDLEYMSDLMGEPQERLISDLTGVIFQNPVNEQWETGDEYLSGNVRGKLELAKVYAENHPEYAVNVEALEHVQPKQLDASEIEVRLGATWVEPNYITDFMAEIFETPAHKLSNGYIGVQYSDVTGLWNIKGKSADYGNVLVEMTYGTGRANAYKILEDSLNLKDCRIFDVVMEDGKEKRVLNKKETMLASQKQEAIREAFKDWIFRDGERRETLCQKYNELFNSSRPREYDGTHTD